MSNVSFEEALALAQAGLRVFPTRQDQKHPLVPWRDQIEMDPIELVQQHRDLWETGGHGAWVATGLASGWIVLDCDNDEAIELWQRRLDAMPGAGLVATGKGVHYWYRLDQACRSYNHESDPEALELGARYDVRADGGGVIVPPTIHWERRKRYRWLRELSPSVPVAPLLLSRGPAGTSTPGATGEQTGGHGRTALAALLASPPVQGSRNVWLAKVAGHLARSIPFFDGYAALVEVINDWLPEPLPQEEVTKMVASLWKAEERKVELPEADTGYLVGRSSRLWTLVKGPDDEEILGEWAPFNLRVLGRIPHDEETLLRLAIEEPGLPERIVEVEESRLAGSSAYGVLAGWNLVLTPPRGDRVRIPGWQRLLAYLKAQEAPVHRLVPWMGDVDGVGFVADGTVFKDGHAEPMETLVPARARKDVHYGIGAGQTAREILRQVLTFHHPETVAVFGSWWAAALVKGWIMERTSLFPMMAIEAPSESGKTNGFFSLMISLAGCPRQPDVPTLPVLRDRLGAHRNGIVWIDDVTRLDGILEMIRTATSESTWTKKGNDRHTDAEYQLVAPVLLSAESMAQIHNEKALTDRAVILTPPSPVGRRSLHDPDRPQWDDVRSLMRRYPDLREYAGNMIMLAQAALSGIEVDVRSIEGRAGDKELVLLLGSQILVEMAGEGFDWIHDYVQNWIRGNVVHDESNSLVRQVIPRVIHHQGGLSRCVAGSVFPSIAVWEDADDGRICYREQELALQWRQVRGLNPRELELGSQSSLAKQRARLQGIQYERGRLSGGRYGRWWKLSQADSAEVLDRLDLEPSWAPDTLL